jgi:hypothetical protein
MFRSKAYEVHFLCNPSLAEGGGSFPLTPTLSLGGEREIREVIFYRPGDKKPGIHTDARFF